MTNRRAPAPRTTVAVDSAALEAFRAAVFRRHNRIHGLLRREATNALLAHIERLRRGEGA